MKLDAMKSLVENFALADDWSGHTVGELRNAIDAAMVTTLLPIPDDYEKAYESLRNEFKSLADHAVYVGVPEIDLLNKMLGKDDGRSVSDLLLENRGLTLGSPAKDNFLVGYGIIFFYKYIHDVELPNLLHSVRRCGSYRDGAEAYMKGLLRYRDPSRGLPDGATRLANLLEAGGGDFDKDPEAEVNVELFKTMFYFMTYYVGSTYRRLHVACTTLLNMDMSSFRGLLYETAPEILGCKGSLEIGGFY